MTRRYFSQREINTVKNGMKVTYYEEYYKPSTRHGIPTAIIIVVSNVETIKKKKIKKIDIIMALKIVHIVKETIMAYI